MVVFLHGPPAAGKRTIGALLAARTGLPLFHNHLAVDLALSLFPFGSPGFRALRATTWLAAFTEATRAGQPLIFTFNPEASVDPALVDQLVRAAAGNVHFVELQCADDAIEARLGDPERQAWGKLTDVALYRSLRDDGAFAFPPLPEPLLTIDTATTRPEAAAQAIHEALQGAGAL